MNGKNSGHESAKDSQFKGIVVGSTALGMCALIAVLTSIEVVPEAGVTLRWHWTTLLWLAAGAGSVTWLWNSVWAISLEANAKTRRQVKCALAAFLTVSLAAFLYPARFAFGKNGNTYFLGVIVAAVALGTAGLLIHWLVRICEEQDRVQLNMNQKPPDSNGPVRDSI